MPKFILRVILTLNKYRTIMSHDDIENQQNDESFI